MKIRHTVIAIATASLLVIPATSAVAGDRHDDCRDDRRSFEHKYGGDKHKDYKYAPDKECDKKDKDHRDKDRDKGHDKDRDKGRDKPATAPVVQKSTSSTSAAPASKAGRVLKTG